MINFTLKAEYIELNKLLKVTNLCASGGAAGQAIVEGFVQVDGQIERRKACKIHRGQMVEFAGETILIQ